VNVKDKAIFVAEVAAVMVLLALFQSKVMNVPIVGMYLPGYTDR
jgi:hypothetical protein